jgi:hypothetical protein
MQGCRAGKESDSPERCPGLGRQDGCFIHNGKTLLSGRDPAARAEKAADNVSLTDRTLYFCPSPLYGYGFSRLLSRLEKEMPGSVILCVEADPELYELTQKNIDKSILGSKQFRVTDICDSGKLYAFIREAWGARAFRRIEMLRFTGGWQLFAQVYDSLCDFLRREIATDWSNALTLTKLGRLYIKNSLRNLSLAGKFPSVTELSFGEENVLVLGAGPSLDKILDELEYFSGNRCFKIICVDTCLGALKDRGIVPDLVVILESQHWNLKDFIGCSGWNVPAAIDISSLPASAKKLGGDGFLFFTPWTQLSIFERLRNADLLPAVFEPLGSVGLTAVEIARRLTKGKIICAGLDFSFTADKYHACGTPGHRGKLNSQTRLARLFNTSVFEQTSIAAVSKDGQSVHTSPIMKNYRNLFEQEFGGDSRVFDIKGTGLPLGVKTLTVKEAIDLLKMDTEKFSPRCQDAEERKGETITSVLLSFFEDERKRLEELRDILTGEAAADTQRLSVLIEECDYLWAHFPDCGGGCKSGRKPNPQDVSFLNRVRVEIDSFLKLMNGFDNPL